ncbi:MAG: tRNA 2-thiouridine(34) synthase MnmA [Coriobacteriia bacterium]|nr:tRNA 2-thiouridine(34) synthase MnmA [Coriobacteriia bacterium]
MSGGVDSSVAAARLVQAGFEVTGVTMRLLREEGEGPARSADAVHSARMVCEHLGITHHVLDVREEFARCVIEPFVSEYAQGRTPNPCVFCNDRLKFSVLFEHVRRRGGDALATGHYARIACDPDGSCWLERGLDRTKDQSYFLYRLGEPVLREVVFPLGDATKEQVRAEARELRFSASDRPESQEICFVSDEVGSFVTAGRPSAGVSGPIIDDGGRLLGAHRGIAHYTLGQRKGLGLSGGPWYVRDIRAATNTLVVSAEGPAMVTRIDLVDSVWRMGDCEQVDAVTRYRSAGVRAEAIRTPTGLSLVFGAPVARVAPGQAVVCYMGDRVVGGGMASVG